MEIFLLLVLIVLVIVFHTTFNAKFRRLHEHMNHMQRELARVIQNEGTIAGESKVVHSKSEDANISEQKIVPPVITKEEIIENSNEVPPVINEEKFEQEPVLADIPVIENEQLLKKPVVRSSWWTNFKERNPDLEKFIGENLLSKIAITILVLGIAFFVKYAIDQNWINEAARAGIGVLCGSVVMAFAHKLRLKFKPFSSVLVAGAIAIFYFTIGIGFHEYHLFSQTVAFVIMFVITSFAVFISVAYDRVELAALAITGGFAVPFMLSTGQGNYKILFTYILILDLGMLVLAYIKKWNLVNILAYAFTIILYSAWLGSRVIGQPAAPYKGAFFFGMVFYSIFILMNIVNNIKEKREFNYIDLIILISNTFVFYACGMLILAKWQPDFKGVFTIVMALVNFMLGITLYKYFKTDKKLIYLLIGMTLTFATLAAPVQLKGNYITLFWGAEAALLLWLSQRSQLKAFRLASVIVTFLMFVSLMIDLGNVYGQTSEGLNPVINKGFITGFVCSIFLFVSVWLLRQENEKENFFGINSKVYATITNISGIFVLYLTGFLEIHQQSAWYLYSSDTVVSVSAFYHITFTTVLGLLFLRNYSVANNIVSFVLLSVNVLYYCFVFSITPFEELQQRCRAAHQDYLGYLVHFVALAFLAAHIVFTVRRAVEHRNFLISARSVFLWIFGIVSVYILSNETILDTLMVKLHSFVRAGEYYVVEDVYNYFHKQVIKVALPVLWGAIAFVFLSIGIKKQLKQLRIIALVLLAVTLIKLFTYDINGVSEAGKIIAFIILGVVLLVMSFMYQKIKALILDEQKDSLKDDLNNTTADETIPG